jgi:WD40 repeat protein/serine/threonine protein kinase
MDQQRWKKIDDVFEQMLEIELADRAEALARISMGDDDLRRGVEALLKFESPAEEFLQSSAIADLAEQVAGGGGALAPRRQIGHYEIKERIGAGGMGEVWRAWDKNLDRDVAIKILPPEFSADVDRIQRFEREARTISRLKHSNIIAIHEIVNVTDEHGDLRFIVTELVEGRTLRERLNDSRIGWREAARIAAQIADALKTVHIVEVIHRDIKPENVMIEASERVKLLDFGIAKSVVVSAEGSGSDPLAAGVQTKLGATPGTLRYMSPEQARGEDLDARTDVFSLGLVLYEMIAGRHPYTGESDEEIVEKLKSEDEIQRISEAQPRIPSALDRIVTKALKKKREERYTSGSEMAAELESLKSLIEMKSEKEEGRSFRVENADRLLTQFVVFHAADPKTRIPLPALWTIRRFSGLKRGKLERELRRKSLVRGLAKAAPWVLLIVVATTVLWAWKSVSETWEERVLRDGHTAAVRRAAFSPDGRLLVSVGEDNKVIVWDFARREMLKKFDGHTDWVISVTFSPDGKWFATASYDRTVIVWDAARLEKAATLRGHREGVCAVAFSPDGRLLVSAAKRADPPGDDTILWRVGSWEKVEGIPCGAGEPQNLLFSQDGRRLIFHNGGCHAPHDTWDLTTGQPLPSEFDPTWYGNNAVFSPDSKRLVSMDSGGEVIFVDWRRHSTLARYPAHQDNGRATAWSPNGRFVATGAENVILWDAVTMRKISTLEHSSYVWGLAFSPDSHWLISTHGDGSVLVWDMVERRLAANFNEHSGQVSAVAFDPGGKHIASASDDRTVNVWGAATGRKEMTMSGHDTRVTGLAFAPGGEWLASADRDRNVIIWDLAQRRPRLRFDLTLRGQTENHCLVVSPDGRWIASSHGVYESANGRQVVGFDDASRIYGLTFSADGRWLALADASGNLLLWDTETWRIAYQANIAPAQLISVSFSPDGEWLVTGEDQGTVRLWSARPLRQVAELGRHKARVKSVAFSPGGEEVVSAGDDKTICLWDVQRRNLITRVGTHTSPVLSVAFSPDGKQIVSGERDHSVRLYTRRRELWGCRLDN